MSMPARTSFEPTNIYLIFNSLNVYLFVGYQADQAHAPNPAAIQQLFQVAVTSQINPIISEE